MKLADASIIDILQYLSFDRILSAKNTIYLIQLNIYFFYQKLYLMYRKKP